MKPDVAELCAMGEAAFSNDEFEEAEAWYELACSGRYRNPDPNRLPRHDYLIEKRFARWEELRAMMWARSVRRLEKPDPGHIMFVMTCAARGELLQRTLTSIEKAGGGPWLNVLCDSGRGQATTFFEILRRTASIRGMTSLTLFEDDIVLAKNAFDYIATTKIDDDLAFISWFSTTRYVGPRLPPLFNCIEARDYQFNQAITFPARTVHELLASDALKNWSEPHGADRIYKDVFPDRKVGIHYPNLVQHVGGSASLVGNNHQGLRTSPSFIGEAADALELLG